MAVRGWGGVVSASPTSQGASPDPEWPNVCPAVRTMWTSVGLSMGSEGNDETMDTRIGLKFSSLTCRGQEPRQP